MSQKTWDEYFITLAKHVATKSKDRSTKVGVVLVGEDNEVLSVGFNGFPRGIDDTNESYHERPMKYKITEHAERNAVYNAARRGIKIKGATAYFNDGEPHPCTDCARAFVQAGIVRVVGTNKKFAGKRTDASGNNYWEEDCAIGANILRESGVIIDIIDLDE
jgi:dCMP deaminase